MRPLTVEVKCDTAFLISLSHAPTCQVARQANGPDRQNPCQYITATAHRSIVQGSVEYSRLLGIWYRIVDKQRRTRPCQ